MMLLAVNDGDSGHRDCRRKPQAELQCCAIAAQESAARTRSPGKGFGAVEPSSVGGQRDASPWTAGSWPISGWV